jgi:2-iminobutanoate/2-iminopropanoate deaminase
MQNFAQVNEVYGTYFTDQFPARETVAGCRFT